MTYTYEQVDGLDEMPKNDSFVPYSKSENKLTFCVFPSRSTHRVQIKAFGSDWLEIVAWLIKTNTETGATYVLPITQFGSCEWEEVKHYQGPNMRKSQEHW